MKRYYKKSEILREMWKNPKDVRLLGRMIARWEIIEEWNKWRFTNDHETDIWQKVDKKLIWEVDKKLTLLEQELEKVKQENEKIKQQNINLLKENKKLKEGWNNDLIDHLALMYTYIEQKNEFMKKVVKSFYDKYSWQYDWGWAKDKVYKLYWYVEDTSEEEEIKYVKSIIG